MQDKNIILGITGGIAAYKSAELVRILKTAGANIKVVMTKNAQQFITPLTMQTLSGNPVYCEMFMPCTNPDLEHIELARWADAIVVAPATANFMAKIKNGFADDLLSTICLATTAPIAIAPAMNKEMWHAAITQHNIEELKNRGVFVFGPDTGEQACGEIGLGRMIGVQEIFELIPLMFSSKLLDNKKVVITAGPTFEAIDPVRYLGNWSSGKMGYALASACQKAGANVTLISGPTNLPCPPKVKYVSVQTADEMLKAVMQEIFNCNIFIANAAVCDFRPKTVTNQKIKKDKNKIVLELQCNPDIVAEVAALDNPPFIVGFAAETQDLIENAKEKLKTKNLNMIIANQVGKDLGFNCEENSVTILDHSFEPLTLPLAPKPKLAQQIITIIADKYNAHN